ncbi:MAG: hypothetical protein WAT09_16365 [Paracoccaceae bacterium]
MILLASASFGLTQAAQAQTLLVPQGGVLPFVLLPDTAATPSPLEDMLWLVQSCEGKCDDYTPKKGARKARYGTNLNKGTTRDIVKFLTDANKTCDARIDRRYRIDCLRIYYGWIADSLPDTGDYLPIKQAMRKAEKKLAAIVSANVDTTAPVITPRKGHKPSAKKMPPLRPIKKSAERKAVAQAEAVLKETEIVILRSGEDPTRRTAHYEEVSAALDSNLVILRSA